LQALEPRFEKKNSIILDELDECNEVYFITNGTYEIGFSINGV
jgi:hypothetical protein